MGYCAPRGIPHSAFLAWRRRDRELALWWLVHERQRCPSCGTRADEWDPKKGGDPHAYQAVGVHCRGCEVLAPMQDELEKRKASHEARRGTTITLRPPRPPEQPDEQPEEAAMATMLVHTGDAQKQLIELQRRLRKAANGKELQRDLNRRIQIAGQTALRDAQAGFLAIDVTSSAGGGTKSTRLRQRVVDATEIALLARGIRIRVVARKVDPVYGRSLARSLNDSRGIPWVHGLFGNEERQYSQRGENKFEPAIRGHAPAFRRAALQVMHDIADMIKEK